MAIGKGEARTDWKLKNIQSGGNGLHQEDNTSWVFRVGEMVFTKEDNTSWPSDTKWSAWKLINK